MSASLNCPECNEPWIIKSPNIYNCFATCSCKKFAIYSDAQTISEITCLQISTCKFLIFLNNNIIKVYCQHKLILQEDYYNSCQDYLNNLNFYYKKYIKLLSIL